jgi:hypothetical protein
MPPLRLPRFQRSPDISGIRLTARDREIIQLVHKHRFLRSRHIVALLNASRQRVLRRTQRVSIHWWKRVLSWIEATAFSWAFRRGAEQVRRSSVLKQELRTFKKALPVVRPSLQRTSRR